MITQGKIKDVCLAYAAGGIDADGSISICKVNLKHRDYKSPRYVLEVTYTNTYEDIVNWFQNNFGGSWKNRKIRDRRGHEGKMLDGRVVKSKQLTYEWKITSQKALSFLRIILPYLIGKKRQAELAIEFQENMFNRNTVAVKAGKGLSHRLSLEEIEKREWYHQMVMKLNKHQILPVETKRANTN